MSSARKAAPEAVVFDFDGVLFDTEPLHWRAFARVLAPRGVRLTWEEYTRELIGYDDRGVFQYFAERGIVRPREIPDLVAEKGRVFARLAAEARPRPLPGAETLVQECAAAGLPLAVCSGAARQDIRLFLDRWEPGRHFQVVVAAEDVPAGKPDPAGYRLTLRRLGRVLGRVLDAARAVAVEDTAAGMEAARRAGLKVVLVGEAGEGELPAEVLPVPTLERVTVSRLEALVGGSGRRLRKRGESDIVPERRAQTADEERGEPDHGGGRADA